MSGMRIINADALSEGVRQNFCNVCESYKDECDVCEIAEILRMIDSTETLTNYVDGVKVVKALRDFCISDGCEPNLDCSDCGIGQLLKELNGEGIS